MSSGLANAQRQRNLMVADEGEIAKFIASRKRKRPPEVLEEDAYTAAVTKIIERDFFPQLKSLRHTWDQMNGITANAYYQESENAPVAPDTPMSWASEVTGVGGGARNNDNFSVPSSSSRHRRGNDDDVGDDDSRMSIQQFFRKYTSEDNSAFEQLQKDDMKEHRKKFHW